jgi:glutathione synthase/RimK-type ligase-like ATP-grasp enzyme
MATDQKLGTAELLYRCAKRMGLQPAWVVADDLFAVKVGEEEQFINFARSPLNSHVSASLAKDKYLTRLILERNGLPNIPFARPHSHAEAEAFLKEHATIIAKPVCGAGAHDIHIVTTSAQLQALDVTGYILEKYVAGKEMRYLVLNGSIVAMHQSDYGVSVEETRPLQRISYPPAAWDPILVSLSLRIARILGLSFAAVDYLIDPSGQHYVLEVNTTPGLKWFHAPTSGPVVDVARLFLESMLIGQDVQSQSANDVTLRVHTTPVHA